MYNFNYNFVGTLLHNYVGSSFPAAQPQAKVVITRQEPLSEEDSRVQELMGAGFSPEESIRALEMSGAVQEAMEYLLVADDEANGLFSAIPPAEKIPPHSQPTLARSM